MTSPVNMFTSGTAPPAAVSASWPPLTDPLEAFVVATAQFEVAAIPYRTSLSAMLPPLDPSPAVMFTPESRSTCEPCCSEGRAIAIPIANIASIAPKIGSACLRAFTMRPNMNTCAAGISRIASIWRKFVKPVGVSNGTAEFEL